MLWNSWWNVWPGRSLPNRRRAVSGSPLKRSADVAGSWSKQRIESLEDRVLLSAGDLDPSFGTNGSVTTSFGASPGGANHVAIDPNGRIIVVGATGSAPNRDFAVARYNSDGSLDTTFDVDGRLAIPFGLSDDSAASVAIDQNGQIVVAGSSSNTGGSNYDFAVVRLNSDGSLDPTFGTGGKTTTAFGTSEDVARDVVIDPSGKIVVLGWTRSASGDAVADDLAVVRYNADGSLDTTFGTGGKVKADLGTNNDKPAALAIDGSGKIVMAATIGSWPFDVAVSRLNSDGSVDSSFGNNGIRITDFGSIEEHAYDMAIDEGDRIVVVGSTRTATGLDFAVARYTTDGSLDSAFGNGGKLTTDLGASDIAKCVIIDAGAKIIVAGSTGGSLDRDSVVVRYNPDGSLDSTFGSGGQITTNISGEATDAVIDGRA